MPELISQAAFRKLADLVFNTASAKHVSVSLSDDHGGTTRFANNQISQNVNVRRQSLSISVATGNRTGAASTTELSERAIRDAVAAAEEIARVSPEDPEYLPPLDAQKYPLLATYRPETAAVSPARRADAARIAVEACKTAGMQAAGVVEAYAGVAALAANSGLFAYEQRTRAQFTLTATAADSSGWVGDASRSIDDFDISAMSARAIEKAQKSANPAELPAGLHTVILEPAAVAGLVGPLFGALDARDYNRGTSALAGKLGERVVDSRLTLRNRPDHPSLLGAGFNGFGLPTDYHAWIDNGVLKRLSYDRFTAQQQGVTPSYGLDAPVLEGAPAGASETVDDLIAKTERGVLVTTFWYIRHVNENDLTLTGMTRDGLFSIVDGRIAGGLLNFRWHESPLRALNQIEAYTRPLGAIAWERDKMMLPALKIRDFNFSSVTKF